MTYPEEKRTQIWSYSSGGVVGDDWATEDKNDQWRNCSFERKYGGWWWV